VSALSVRADARSLPLVDGSVDLIVTSPPYFGLRDYGSPDELGTELTVTGFVSSLLHAAAEMRRVLSRTGSIFVNLADTYAAYNANRGDGRLVAGRRRGARSVRRVWNDGPSCEQHGPDRDQR
jgi:DNA modification methylase